LKTRNKIRALLLAALIALSGAIVAGLAPEAAFAQNSSPAAQSDKIIKTRFEVVSMQYQSLQVRSLSNQNELHTFTYSPAVRPKMQKVQSAGGYKYGDKVTVWYRAGADVALKVKGKPSKHR
jgi:membrane-bound inhibitor of C-type lysozyme